MELIDVVMKLNGPVEPVGETHIDGKRLANLESLCQLTSELLDRIEAVAETGGDHMAITWRASRRRSALPSRSCIANRRRTAMHDWIALSERTPDEGVVVDTRIEDSQGARNEQPLKRRGNLWFVEDGSMYVYYRPTHWRPTDQQARAERLRGRLASMDAVRATLEAELRAASATPSARPDAREGERK